MITQEKAVELLRLAVGKHGEKHPFYSRVVDLASTYTTIATGYKYEKFITIFQRREDDEDHKNRINLTSEPLSRIFNPIKVKFAKTSRLQNIRRDISYEGDNAEDVKAKIRLATKNFYGGKDLEKYVHEIVDNLGLIDPNAFVFLSSFIDENNKPRLYPSVFFSKDVLNFKYSENGELEYVIVKRTYQEKSGVVTKKIGEQDAEDVEVPIYKAKEFTNYYLYSKEFVISLEREYNVTSGLDDVSNAISRIEVNKDAYLVKEYINNTGAIPCFRIGYLLDPLTGFSTCVSPLEPAVSTFKDICQTKSNKDLVKLLNAFEQKIQFVPPCPDVERIDNPCRNGKIDNGKTVCPTCKGTGRRQATQPQDTIEFRMPKDPNNLFDLDKIVHYVKRDNSTLSYLDNDLVYLSGLIYVSVFSTEVIQNSEGRVYGDRATAQEVSVKRDDINDTLQPFAEQKSNIIRHLTKCVAAFSIPDIALDKLTITHEYPKDLKLSSLSELITDLTMLTAAKSSDVIRGQAIDDLARKMYDGDDIALEKYEIISAHVPFKGMTGEEVATAVGFNVVSRNDVYLYYNKHKIFREIESQHPEFFLNQKVYDYETRKGIIDAMVESMMPQTTGNAQLSPRVVDRLTTATNG